MSLLGLLIRTSNEYGGVLRFRPSFKSMQVKNYAVFPPTFVKPVYHPDELKKLSPEEARELSHKPVLPPFSHQNSSVFHDPLLNKFINKVMIEGKKALAREIIFEAFEKIKRAQVRKFHLAKDSSKQQNILTNPLEIFHLAIENCKPVLEIIPVKRGGVTYKVPIAITDKRATYWAMKWMVVSSREREPRRNHTGEYFSDRLAAELMNAAELKGKTVRKKIEHHKICEANKAFAHYRWT